MEVAQVLCSLRIATSLAPSEWFDRLASVCFFLTVMMSPESVKFESFQKRLWRLIHSISALF